MEEFKLEDEFEAPADKQELAEGVRGLCPMVQEKALA